MEYSSIGNEIIPRIVIGTWSWGDGLIGGNGIFGNTTDETVLKEIFVSALRNGFTMYDTAEVYSFGESERILGNLIRYYNGKVEIEEGTKKQVLISSKYMPMPLMKKGTLTKSVFGSLNRLGADSIDIFWIHIPRYYKQCIKEVIPLMKANRIKNVGLSNFKFSQLKDAVEIFEREGIKVAGVQNHMSLLYRDSIDKGILDWCKEKDIKFFAYMVMEQGALSGKYTKDNPLPRNSDRGRRFNRQVLAKMDPLLNLMKEIADKHDVAQSQIPIAWALSKGTIPIIGATKQQHVYELTKAFDIKLSEEEIEKLEKVSHDLHIHKKGFWEPKQ